MKKRLLLVTNNLLNLKITTREIIFILFAVACTSPLITPPFALIMGLIVAQFIGHPYLHLNHKATHILLQISVVGLGFGMNINQAIQEGKSGFLFTIVSIFSTLVLGFFLGKLLRVNKQTSYLVSVGTAICGGSAIAAISPIIKAEEKQISVALGTVFILNSVALFLFPTIGHWLHLTQTQFGLWAAIAIHDTSSVVGASSKYGANALAIATTVKLARALWIIPVAFLTTFIFKTSRSKIKIPYFIGLFILAMLLNTFFPLVHAMGNTIVSFAQSGLTLTLFLIGSGLSKKILQSVGFKPMLLGVIIWLFISSTALWVIIKLI